MRYLTDRKRATGMGSAKSGVHHFWSMKLSSAGLLILMPLFVFTFGGALGGDHATITEYFARPFPAIIAILTFIVGFKHFNDGAQVLIEDYVHGTAQKVALILLACLSYGLMAAGVFAVLKLAL